MTKDDFLSAWNKVTFGYHFHSTENSVGSFTIPAFEQQSWLGHGFSARTGGISEGHLASLNLSFTREEEPRWKTMENYRIYCKAEGIPVESMVMDSYEHGTTVLCVDRNDCGKGYSKESLPPCDGLITNDPAVTLMTGHADCMAFYFADTVGHCIGLCHAGWRGAFSRIGCEVVRMMRETFQAKPENIIAGIGPSICPDCFEVDTSLGEEFQKAFPATACLLPGKKDGKSYVNLWQVAACQFMEAGIPAEQIHVMGVCTVEDPRLFSYRGDKRQTGGATAYLRIM